MNNKTKRKSVYILLALLIAVCVSVIPAAAQTTILSQPRIMPGDFAPYDSVAASPFNDADVDECPNRICVLAEDFVMPAAGSITEVTIWGGYWHGSTPPATEIFEIIFHNDSGGSIGTMAADPAFTFTRTNIGSVPQKWYGGTTTTTEFEYVFTLTTPVSLSSGTYWIEFYGDTTGHSNGNDFFSRWGHLDTTNGIDGLAWTTTSAPGSSWQYDATGSLAIEIAGNLVPEPVSSSLFIVGGATLGFRRFWKKRRNA